MARQLKHFHEPILQTLLELECDHPNQAAFPGFRVSTVASFAGISDLRGVSNGLRELKRDELVIEMGSNWRISAAGKMLLAMSLERGKDFVAHLEAIRR